VTEFRIAERIDRDVIEVYAVDPPYVYHRVSGPGYDDRTQHSIEPGQAAEAFLVFDRREFAAFAAAILDSRGGIDSASADAIRDARATRDRLLALVERTHASTFTITP
jgi:hypothetical protein